MTKIVPAFTMPLVSEFDPSQLPPRVPIPVQPLEYSTPWQQSRPGLITTIGVLCIVIACLGILSNLFSGLQGFGMLMMSSIAPRASTTATVTTSSYSFTTTSNEKLTVGEAGVANNTLRGILALDGRRQRELDKLLRTHGRVILGGDDDDPLTAAGIRQAITQYKSPSVPTDPAQFTTSYGTVDIYPDHADFTSNDGTHTVHTSAAHNSESTSSSSGFNVSQSPSASIPSSTTLTPTQVRQVLGAVRSHAAKPLNVRQISTLRSQLSAPNQQLVTPGSATPVMNVTAQGSNVLIQFEGGMLTLGPQGQIGNVFSYGSAAAAGPVAMPNFSSVRTPAIFTLLESLASLALAIFLLIVGILVFRASFKSPHLLRIYAWLKIPLAIAGGILQAWLWYELMYGMTAATGVPSATPPSIFVFGWAIGMTALSIAFPIGLLIALRTRTARAYYDSAAAT